MRPYTYADIIDLTLSAGLLPDRMNTRAARRLVFAAAYQESEVKFRRQGGGGPARGFAQFELGGPDKPGAGIRGVLVHKSAGYYLKDALKKLNLPTNYQELHPVLEWNDMATVLASRCLIWTLPQVLPATELDAYRQYDSAWRPSAKRPHDWPVSWRIACEVFP